jgi:hypothetical protein
MGALDHGDEHAIAAAMKRKGFQGEEGMGKRKAKS